MLIARLIADPATLETRLDAASAALAARGLPVASAAMLDACSEVLQIATPGDDDLCAAPELAILTALEASLAVAAQVLNIAHTEILAPGDSPHHTGPDTKIAAEIIAQASRMIAAINRYRIALLDPDTCP